MIPEHLLGIAILAAHKVSVTIAQLHPEQPDRAERVVAHKSIDCRWYELSPRGQREALRDALRLAEESAGVQVLSLHVAIGDTSFAARSTMGAADLGDEVAITPLERALALRRCREQATAYDREIADVLPLQWLVNDHRGERVVEDPVGERAKKVICQGLLVTARRGLRAETARLVADLGLELEGIIPQPLALYRGIAARLRSRGTQLVLDCGARHTTVLVRRKDQLALLATHAFGGDDLTARIADDLGIDVAAAEALKHQIDITAPRPTQTTAEGQQLIFVDLLAENRQLGRAARVCEQEATRFFRTLADDLRGQGMLAQAGALHLVGRGAHLAGLAVRLREIFELPVVLGTGDRSREPAEELENLLISGLVRIAADRRREHLGGHQISLRRHASGLWQWLAAPLA